MKNAIGKILLGLSLHSALSLLAITFLPWSLYINSPFKPSVKLYIYYSDVTVSHVKVQRETAWKLRGTTEHKQTNKQTNTMSIISRVL